MPRRLIDPIRAGERRELDAFRIKWHFFAPFFAGIFGLVAAFIFVFLTSMTSFFGFYRDRQSQEAVATIQNAITERQEHLRNELSFVKDDADFKNAFYYASESLVSLKKPLADYLAKYKPLVGVDYVEAVTPDGKMIFSQGSSSSEKAYRAHPLAVRGLSPTEITTKLVQVNDTPWMTAAIPVRQFGKLIGFLLVDIDFGRPLLDQLRGITRQQFFFLDSAGRMAASTLTDAGFRQILAGALGGRKGFPFDFHYQGSRFVVSALPMSEGQGQPPAFLYAVSDQSAMESFQRRSIRNAVLLFLLIAAVSFFFSYVSSQALSMKVNRLLEEMTNYRLKAERQERLSALGELAAQISHDIRSPLAALDSVLRDVSELQEEKRLMIRGAAGRIRDIANHLIRTNQELRGLDKGAAVPAEPPTIQLLSSIIEPLVTEKRLQFRSRMGIEIDAPLDEASYGLFAEIAPGIFKRVLSNLINNAVEALDDRGSVTIRLSAKDDEVLLEVKDDGKGIPAEVLPRIGEKGVTHGKAGGSGLGLHHARTSVESWRGRLEIQSASGAGTTASVYLPKVPPPNWFVSKLALPLDSAVVILDDDTSIHQVWQGRLTGASRDQPVEIVHVSTPQEIRSWIGENPAKARKALYLLDYELLGYQETGLSLAAELGIGRQTILVTSRYDAPEILEECRRLEARMIPKLLAGLVPIEVASGKTRWDAVLIDDDPLARTTWRMTASRLGKSFRSFSTAAEFLEAVEEIDRGTPVYVDAELAGGVKGSLESRRIRQQGFAEVYLATGHDPETFADLDHLSGVVGKEPPWS